MGKPFGSALDKLSISADNGCARCEPLEVTTRNHRTATS